MKKLFNKIGESLKKMFSADDPNKFAIEIPKTFRTKKEQNYMIRRTKEFILEHTIITK